MCVRVCVFSVCCTQKLDLPLHEAECDSVKGVEATSLVRLALRALTRNTKHLYSRKS